MSANITEDGACAADERSTTVDASGAYTLADLQAAPYGVIASLDVDGDGSIGTGDLEGAYPQPVLPPDTGVDITLRPYGGGAPTEDLSGSWSGSITDAGTNVPLAFILTQDGGDLSGTVGLTQTNGNVIEVPVTGTVQGVVVTMDATFPTVDGGTAEFLFEGALSGATLAGTVTVTIDDGTQGTVLFSVTRGGTAGKARAP